MDSDAEMDSLEANLLNKFRSMGTTDKDVLISQFQDLLGFQLNPSGCEFFLEMAGWNLQSAIGAYYDFEGGQESKLPSMSLVCDVTFGQGESVPFNAPFVKTWRIKNNGKEDWPAGCCLRFLNGEKMGCENSVSLPRLSAGEIADISINLISPASPGVHKGQWRTYTNTDTPFGDSIYVIISVQPNGLVGITPQIPLVNCQIPENARESVFSARPNMSSHDPQEEEMQYDDSSDQNSSNVSNFSSANSINSTGDAPSRPFSNSHGL